MKEVNDKNVASIVETLAEYLTEDEKVKIYQTTMNHLISYKDINGTDRELLASYLKSIEEILIKSRLREKENWSKENNKQAAFYVAMAALWTAAYVMAAAVALGGVIALGVVLSPVWFVSLVFLIPTIFLVGVVVVGGDIAIFDTDVFTKKEEKLIPFDNKIEEGKKAYNKFYSFFTNGEIDCQDLEHDIESEVNINIEKESLLPGNSM